MKPVLRESCFGQSDQTLVWATLKPFKLNDFSSCLFTQPSFPVFLYLYGISFISLFCQSVCLGKCLCLVLYISFIHSFILLVSSHHIDCLLHNNVLNKNFLFVFWRWSSVHVSPSLALTYLNMSFCFISLFFHLSLWKVLSQHPIFVSLASRVWSLTCYWKKVSAAAVAYKNKNKKFFTFFKKKSTFSIFWIEPFSVWMVWL